MADMKLRLLRLSGRTLGRLISLVQKTSDIQYDPPDLPTRLKAAHPCIVAAWHGQFMMLSTLRPEGTRVAAMVARHGDAELIGEAMQRLGVELIRGAGAGSRKKDRGGAAALRGAVKALDDGASLVMTADIPPGPARISGIGIIMIARLSGRGIVPVAAASSRMHSLDTWSRMTINLPYSRLVFSAGDTIFVPRDADAETLEAKRHELEVALNAAMVRAYDLAGADIDRATPLDQLAALTPPPPGWGLKTYAAAMTALRPAAPLLLDYRGRRGKEDPTRRGERLGFAGRPRPPGQLIWLHAASVGETNAVLPLIEALLAERSSAHVLLTTGTTTSAQLAEARLPKRAFHQFIPLDAPAYATRFLEHWKPDLAIFTESDVWPNLILAISQRTLPLVLVNARMSPRSIRRWRKNAAIGRVLFSRFSLVLAQNDLVAKTLKRLGAPHVLTAGNLKFEAPAPPIDTDALTRLKAAIQARPVFLAASTHPGEDAAIASAHIKAADKLHKSGAAQRLLTIIAPRHPDRAAAMANMLGGLGLNTARRSKGELPDDETDVYLADTIGELGTFYALSPVAMIGGSLIPHGGQNPMEAVAHGAAILTGPHFHNFREAYDALIAAKGADIITDDDTLATAVVRYLTDADAAEASRAAARSALGELSGALTRTLSALRPFIHKSSDGAVGADT